ncbi:MAG: hypothetical protein LBB56_07215 [Chitinispirillales bacterium]|jgi:lipopolysaccharide export LptBFGC system permease protein LptF|nr:hypothetical protein [Chitinispirillales bacterium]
MSVEILLMAVLAALTVIAYMIAINARGLWRLTLSFLFATCMLGGTVWVIVEHYSAASRSAMQKERRKFENEKLSAEERLQKKEQALNKKERKNSASVTLALISQANNYASFLIKERLNDPDLSHGQLIARAVQTQQQIEKLQNEIKESVQVINQFPETAKLIESAMTQLLEACRLYRQYYYSESSAAERTVEHLIRQNANSAQNALTRAASSVQ